MKLLAALSLLSLTYAAPPEERQSSDSPITLNIRWSNSPLKRAINADGGCSTVNTTSFVAQDRNLFLNIGVPWPARYYVSEGHVYVSPTGQLTYTVPHSANIPAGFLTDLEMFSTNSFLNPFLTYWLCSTDPDYNQWNIWLEYTNDTTGSITNNGMTGSNTCTRIALGAAPYEGGMACAYQ